MKLEDLLVEGRCCSCHGGLAGGCRLIGVARRPRWENPFIQGPDWRLAMAMVCVSCYESKRPPVSAVEFRKEGIRYHALEELEAVAQLPDSLPEVVVETFKVMFKTRRTKETCCPTCGSPFNTITTIGKDPEGLIPRLGTLGLCPHCGALLRVVDEGCALADEAELEGMTPQMRGLLEAWRAEAMTKK